MHRPHRSSFPSLRRVLLADSAVCAVAGLALATFPEPLAAAFVHPQPGPGADPTGLLRVLGGTVLLTGAGVYLTARGRRVRAGAVWAILGVEVAWIAASLALLVLGTGVLTPAGAAAVSLGALLVGAFLWLEARAFRSERARGHPEGWARAEPAR